MNELDIFEEYFYRDLEWGFNARVACCDLCYDEFLSLWPHAHAANNCEFQEQCVSLDWFYEYGRLKSYYSKEQFERLVAEMGCPLNTPSFTPQKTRLPALPARELLC